MHRFAEGAFEGLVHPGGERLLESEETAASWKRRERSRHGQQVADVVMKMGRIRTVGGNRVHVHVENAFADGSFEGFDPRLLARLAQGRREDRVVGRLQVPAWLEPAVQLQVPHQEEGCVPSPRYDRARGNVSLGVRARERVGRTRQKLPDPLERGPLALPGRPVGLELAKEPERGRTHVTQLNHQPGVMTPCPSPAAPTPPGLEWRTFPPAATY